MLRRFESWIGGRYVRSKSRNGFVSLISTISIGGIAIAVAVLIIVLSVVNGFERELRERVLAMSAHATIEDQQGRLQDWERHVTVALADPQVDGAAPYVNGQALLVQGEKLSGAELRGIDPALEGEVSGIAGVIIDGKLDSLTPGAFNIVLGSELAQALRAGIGDKVTVNLADGIVTPAGVVPRNKRFTVSGIYRVGMYEFDRRLAMINISDAQRLFRLGDDVSGIRLSVHDVYAASIIVRNVAMEGRGDGILMVSDWTRRHVNFFRSIQITKSILFVILLMVVAVAAFNIVSTLVMVVKDKQSDIAILRTIGASPSNILRIFIVQGSIIGVTGTLAGLLLGVFLTVNLENIVTFMESAFGIKFLAADVYFISDLPAELRWTDVSRITGLALILALLSTIYPAWRASRTMPAESLRYD
jgi:lipoprotein-releasing system permease protein